jgi:hypothetical protein
MSQELHYPIISVHNPERPKPSVYLNHLTRHSWWRVHDMDKLQPYDEPIMPDQDVVQALVDNGSQENIEAVVEEVMRSNHYCLLNSLPPIAGTKWPITEAIYWHFLEILPPLPYTAKFRGFRMSEPKTANILSAYYYENGHYWHEWVEL